MEETYRIFYHEAVGIHINIVYELGVNLGEVFMLKPTAKTHSQRCTGCGVKERMLAYKGDLIKGPKLILYTARHHAEP